MAGIAPIWQRADRAQSRFITLTVEKAEMSSEPAYGLWSLVIINSLVFIIFAFSFTRPRTARDWRSLSGFSAFIVALFTEMYGFPLTIYILSGWLTKKFPGLDLFSHEAGHLWHTVLGLKGHDHLDAFHLVSGLLILGGFLLLSSGWRVLYEAQRSHRLATTGPYAYVRHPQYLGFLLIMVGFLVQWPTIPTLLMFPVLVVMYVRLARQEEQEILAQFGDTYARYAAMTPAFLPSLRSRPRASGEEEKRIVP